MPQAARITRYGNVASIAGDARECAGMRWTNDASRGAMGRIVACLMCQLRPA